MNNKWLKIFLTASLALNLAFISTFLYHRWYGKRETYKDKPSINQNINLTSQQQGEIKEILKSFRINLLDYKKDILDKRIAIIEAMSDTEFDLEDIEKKTEELNELEKKLNVLFVNTLIEINALLESEQRLAFLYKLSKNWFFIDTFQVKNNGN